MGLLERASIGTRMREAMTETMHLLRELAIERRRPTVVLAGNSVNLAALTLDGTVMTGKEIGKRPKDSIWWVNSQGKATLLGDDRSKWQRSVNQILKGWGISTAENAMKKLSRKRLVRGVAVVAIVAAATAAIVLTAGLAGAAGATAATAAAPAAGGAAAGGTAGGAAAGAAAAGGGITAGGATAGTSTVALGGAAIKEAVELAKEGKGGKKLAGAIQKHGPAVKSILDAGRSSPTINAMYDQIANGRGRGLLTDAGLNEAQMDAAQQQAVALEAEQAVSESTAPANGLLWPLATGALAAGGALLAGMTVPVVIAVTAGGIGLGVVLSASGVKLDLDLSGKE